MKRWPTYRLVLGSGLLRQLVGFTVEIDGAQLCIRPYGYGWFARRFLLSEVKCVELWREDLQKESGPSGRGMRERTTSPRLHVQFRDGRGQLFGPWSTNDAPADFERLRVVLGSLFCGDALAQNVPDRGR